MQALSVIPAETIKMPIGCIGRRWHALSETVQRKENNMRGEITINGKKMTVTELVEAYCELKDLNNQLEFKLNEAEKTIDDLERELRVKDDLLTIKSAISDNSRPSIEWYECEMAKQLEEISRQKAIINNLVETLYLLKME
jgi:chromosome segregation ATPase